jgi:hypothetical protein
MGMDDIHPKAREFHERGYEKSINLTKEASVAAHSMKCGGAWPLIKNGRSHIEVLVGGRIVTNLDMRKAVVINLFNGDHAECEVMTNYSRSTMGGDTKAQIWAAVEKLAALAVFGGSEA